MMTAMLITAIAGVLLSAYGMYAQSEAQEDAAEFNAMAAENQAQWDEYNAKRSADLARNQAEYYEYNAALAKEQADREAKKADEDLKRLISSQTAEYGASGLLIGSGTPLAVMADSAVQAEYLKYDLLREGEIEAWNWGERAYTAEQQAESYLIGGQAGASTDRAVAALNMMKGEQAGTAKKVNTGSTILTGALDVGATYNKYKKKKTTTSSLLLDDGGYAPDVAAQAFW